MEGRSQEGKFEKGHKGFKPIGSKNRETLLKEERRARFDEKISEKWDEIIDGLSAQYVADQFMGKAPDKVEHSGEIKTGESFTAQEILLLKAKVKDKQVNGK